MATYNRISPATLANISPVLNDPADTEDANKLAQVDLQTRRMLYDYLITKFDSSTEKLLAAAVADATLVEKVKGSTSNAGTAQAVVQGTISTPDLRDEAVSTAKIAPNAVTTAKIPDSAITTDKVNAKAVTAAKIADNTITADQLAANAVTGTVLKSSASVDADRAVNTDHVRDGAITAAKLASGAVGAAALPVGTVAGQMLITGDSPFAFAIKSISGDITITKDGVVTLASKTECELAERANNGVAAGASAAATWNVRGVATAWVETWRVPTSAFATIGASGKVLLPIGTYYVEASAPAYKAGKHICRLVRYNVSDVVQETFYGTSEKADAGDACVSRTTVRAKIIVGANDDYLKLEHYTELLEAADGLGIAASSGGTYEVYATLYIRKIA